MLKKTIILLISLISIQIFYSCSGVNTAKEKIGVGNRFWNNDDSENVVDSLVNGLLKSEWILEFSKNKKPKIVIGKIKNLSSENINSDLIEKNIERSFINSGKVTFISSKRKREEIRTNRKNRTDFANKKKFKKYLKPLKSDFFVDGKFELEIDSLITPIKKKYKLSLKITNSKNLESVSSKYIVVIK